MGLNPGDEILWIEEGSDGYRVAASTPERAAMLGAHADLMDEYEDVFGALSESSSRRPG